MTKLAQRQPRVRDPAYLAFLRKQPCACCGAAPPCDAAHIRTGNLDLGKPFTGRMLPDDKWATPLNHRHHMRQHDHKAGEMGFWHEVGKDPFAIAQALYARYLAEGGPGPVKPRKRGHKERPHPVRKAKIQSPGFRKGPKQKIQNRGFK